MAPIRSTIAPSASATVHVDRRSGPVRAGCRRSRAWTVLASKASRVSSHAVRTARSDGRRDLDQADHPGRCPGRPGGTARCRGARHRRRCGTGHGSTWPATSSSRTTLTRGDEDLPLRLEVDVERAASHAGGGDDEGHTGRAVAASLEHRRAPVATATSASASLRSAFSWLRGVIRSRRPPTSVPGGSLAPRVPALTNVSSTLRGRREGIHR